MEKKLKTILLIDDDKATNFIHKIVINKLGLADQVICLERPQKALEYLTTPIDGVYPKPDIIFLDINMPGMDGWEFLTEYRKNEMDNKANQIFIMLTTSLNPDDRKKADEIPLISGFRNKPLTESMLEKILMEYF